MQKRTLMSVLGLIALTMLLPACGGKDEVPAQQESSQTQALVPDSVTEDDLAAAADSTHQTPVVPPEEASAASEELTGNPIEEFQEQAAQELESASIPSAGQGEQSSSADSNSNISGPYSLQLGSFTVLAIAEEKADKLKEMGHAATIEQAEVGGQLYHRLFVRGLADRKSAEKLGEDLHSSLGLSYLVKRR